MRSPEPRIARYVAQETAISAVINTAFSLALFLIVFGRLHVVPVRGVGAYAFDFLPQSFAIAAMSTLVPGAITARRLRRGQIAALPPGGWLPRGLLARTVVMAVVAMVVAGGATCGLLLAVGPAAMGWWPALAGKLAYGAALAGVVTPPGLRAALRR